MHRQYQPRKPAASRLLQHRWDQSHFQKHQEKVKEGKPVVDTKGPETPWHLKHNLKKLQQQQERQSITDRDNRLLSSRLDAISRSKGFVDHRNDYTVRSLNAGKRRENVLRVTQENEAMCQRIFKQKTQYGREFWEDDWKKTEYLRNNIARYPRGLADKQKPLRRVTFTGESSQSTVEFS